MNGATYSSTLSGVIRMQSKSCFSLAAPVVKSWACDCAHRVSHAAQHMHGGIGVDTSYPIHRFTLWSRALELSLGGVGAQLATLGAQLAAGAEI